MRSNSRRENDVVCLSEYKHHRFVIEPSLARRLNAASVEIAEWRKIGDPMHFAYQSCLKTEVLREDRNA